jgi:nicotinate phosphoribosyltransferase
MSDIGAPGSFVSGPVSIENVALLTDLYEITMAAVYFRRRMDGLATFSLFARKLPAARGFLVAAGLEDVLNYLHGYRFSERALAYLESLDRFDAEFIDFLSTLRFTGRVRAVAEGTVVFADEPLLEITAPIVQAQLVESAVLNLVHLQTVLASEAARVVLAASGRPVVEFGLRRTHGLETGMRAARCAYIAGAEMSSNVLAGLTYGIPPTGTMAHSYVSAFPEEIESFRAFAESFPSSTTLLLDTYDTVSAAHKAVIVAKEMEARGSRLQSVRLDSGDLLALSRAVRRILDEAGLDYVRIFASGGLDEDELARLVSAAAPIDAFGVGTRMTTSADAPYLDIAYKLVRYDGRDVLKLSAGKETWTGEKQVYRSLADDNFVGDLIALRDEPLPEGNSVPLLEEVMREGRRASSHPSLMAVREHCAAQLRKLPPRVRQLRGFAAYPVRYSPALIARQRAAEREAAAREIASTTSVVAR